LSAYFDMTAANAALKELYDGQAVETLVYKKNPFLAMVPKFTEFGGKYKPVPIITGVSQGRSSTFANAQANQSPAQIESFLLTSKNDYSIASIDNKTLLASKTDKMAFIQGRHRRGDPLCDPLAVFGALSQRDGHHRPGKCQRLDLGCRDPDEPARHRSVRGQPDAAGRADRRGHPSRSAWLRHCG
jgi:hypothetical protein